MTLTEIPLGTQIHNVEMQPGRGGQLGRSRGGYATLNARDGQWAQITLPSGEVRRVPSSCRATIGQIGNLDHMNIRIGKAGRARWMGIRPYVRGSAMNPVGSRDGWGCEGRRSGGRHPVVPTDVLRRVETRVSVASHRVGRLFVVAGAVATARRRSVSWVGVSHGTFPEKGSVYRSEGPQED